MHRDQNVVLDVEIQPVDDRRPLLAFEKTKYSQYTPAAARASYEGTPNTSSTGPQIHNEVSFRTPPRYTLLTVRQVYHDNRQDNRRGGNKSALYCTSVIAALALVIAIILMIYLGVERDNCAASFLNTNGEDYQPWSLTGLTFSFSDFTSDSVDTPVISSACLRLRTILIAGLCMFVLSLLCCCCACLMVCGMAFS
jgi:hypothetical protein